MKRTKALESTAYHEAGHFVVAWYQGAKLNEISLTSDKPEERGYSEYDGPLDGIDENAIGKDHTPEIRDKCEREIVNTLAGPFAEKKYNPKGFHRSKSQKDFNAIVQILTKLFGEDAWPTEDAEVRAFRKWLEARTRKILNDPRVWQAIIVLAEALLKDTKLSGREAKKIIEQAFLTAKVPRK